MTDNRFEPVNKAHAIVEMVLFFEFVPSLSANNIQRLLALRSELEEDLPSSDVLTSVQVLLSDQGVKQEAKTGGIELRRFKPDGSLEWLIRISETSVSIHCLEYTRWESVWSKVNDYADKVFSKLSGANVTISKIGLKYVDQFMFHGDMKTYDVTPLLKQDSPLLHPHAFRSGSQWHCHTGWFEDAEALGQVLSQLNVDSTMASIQGNQHIVVVIDQTFTRHAMSEGELASYSVPTIVGLETRSRLVNWMHEANKRLLCELLTDSVRNRIRLYTEKTL